MLYLEGRPDGEVSGEILRHVISEVSPDARVEVVESPIEVFCALGTSGSLTMLLDDRDLFPIENPYGALAGGTS